LLGSSTERVLKKCEGVRLWNPPTAFSWADEARLSYQLKEATGSFLDSAAESGNAWRAVWCAGAGVVGSTAAQLRREVRNWEFFLAALGERLRSRPRKQPGVIFFASSAGGILGNGRDSPHTELSRPAPISDYGRCKLEQEEILRKWMSTQPDVSCVIGRISNLYGPGQNINKGQGLISQISRCLIYRRPISIYVSLDTLRDYLYAEDCGKLIGHCLERAATQIDSGGRHIQVTKIMAAYATNSIATILGVFRDIAKKSPQIIVARQAMSNGQPRGSALKSVVWPEVTVGDPTPLATGIANVHRHQLQLFLKGRLPAPGELRRLDEDNS
jgi:UDP-glucose 4-epimerase